MSDSSKVGRLSVLENALFGVPLRELPALFPGLVAAGVLTWGSIWLSKLIGIKLMGFDKSPVSPVILAIILGIFASSVVSLSPSFYPGLTFAVKKVLRLGIILLGIRLTIFDVFKLGAFGVPIVFFCILGALLFTTWINKKLNLPDRLGTLIAVGTSICGVTAVVATSPAIDADEDEAAYAVATITVFGLFATIFYPYISNVIFHGEAVKAGLFLGTAVHETAQVVGAGKIYVDIFSQSLVLDVATIAKLVRNIFMVFVIPIMAFYYNQRSRDRSVGNNSGVLKFLPVFILGFIMLAVLRSLGDSGISTKGLAFGLWGSAAWERIIAEIRHMAEIFLILALAGVGLNTKLASLKQLGLKPFIVGLCASLSVGIISFVVITLLGNLVSL